MSHSDAQDFGIEPATRLTVFLNARDHPHHHSLMVELMHRARRAGLAGATVFHGQEGFGSSGEVHSPHLLSDNAPLAVILIDQPDRIERFLGDVNKLLTDTLLTLEDVAVVEF
ncbi:MAG: DUF190 domain-containing protein [Acidimicrobiales bacterium]